MYFQRDIVLMPFPFTDLSQLKNRPALIISNNLVNSFNEYTCLLITSKIREDHTFFLITEEMLEEPIKLQSGIRLHKLFTVHGDKINGKLSSMREPDFKNVISSLNSKVFQPNQQSIPIFS
jgi:mRNA interferase MazF